MSYYEIKVTHAQAPILTYDEKRKIYRVIDHLENDVWKVPVYARLDRDGVSFFRKPVEELFGDFWRMINQMIRYRLGLWKEGQI